MAFSNVNLDLNVITCQQFSVAGFDIKFRIIGESHWVTIQKAEKILLNEIFACVTLDSNMFAASIKMDKRHTRSLRRDGYTIQIDLQDREIEWYLRENEISVEFPVHPSHPLITPMTRVQWWKDDVCLQWKTLHTYPSEGSFYSVVSHSSFTLEEGTL